MDVFTAIERRRAVKQFDPSHRITKEEEKRLLSYLLFSPTAFNIQHWRFVVIDDPALRAEIRAITWMQPQITEASLLVAICSDVNAWKKEPGRYWRHAPADVREGVLEAMRAYYENRPEIQRDEAMRSVGIAAQTLMLAATAMGYDSCPMDLGDMEGVGKLLRLPEDHVLGMLVAIGKRVRDPWPRSGQLPLEEVVKRNGFA